MVQRFQGGHRISHYSFAFLEPLIEFRQYLIGLFPPSIEQAVEFPINGITDVLGGILMLSLGYVGHL